MKNFFLKVKKYNNLLGIVGKFLGVGVLVVSIGSRYGMIF